MQNGAVCDFPCVILFQTLQPQVVPLCLHSFTAFSKGFTKCIPITIWCFKIPTQSWRLTSVDCAFSLYSQKQDAAL